MSIQSQAQFLNLLMCRCFQLSYIQRHPEEVEEDAISPLPTHAPYLLNQGFPLSVNALVSFRRAPMLGLLSGEKVSLMGPGGGAQDDHDSLCSALLSPNLVPRNSLSVHVFTPCQAVHIFHRLWVLEDQTG